MVATLVGIDHRSSTEFSHPDHQRRLQQSTQLQILQQRPPSGIEDRTETLDRVEVVLVSVPAQLRLAIDSIEGHLDKRHTTFNQPPGQQAPLAEPVATITVPEPRCFVIKIKSSDRLGPHHSHRLPVSTAVTGHRHVGTLRPEPRLKLIEQSQASVGLGPVDPPGLPQVLDPQCPRVIGLSLGRHCRRVPITDDQRSVLGPEKSRAESGGTEKPVRGHTDKTGQRRGTVGQFLAEKRSERGIMNRPLRQVPGSHLESGPLVITFLGRHRPQNREMLGLQRQTRQMLGKLQSGDRGQQRTKRTAVGVSGLHVKGVGLGRSTRHPQQDTTATTGAGSG